MKVAIVHDYLIDFGGAERVLLALHEIFPHAPVYTLIDRRKTLGRFAKKFDGVKVVETWFGKIPGAQKIISPLRFLIPTIWKSVDLTDYDLIISSASWAITKGFDKKTEALEICYCHTPPRYLYGYDTSRRFTGFFGKLVKVYAGIVNKSLRKYNYDRAQKVDYFIANSKEVAGRIKKLYKRDATVIYPPAENTSVSVNKRENYFLTGGRLTAAKNFDLVINAFNKLETPLLVYGDGPQKNYLKSRAKENIKFVGEVTDDEMSRFYAGARAYVVAQKDEDFGITPIEAMAQGTPVIAYRGGGYLETVVDGKTGIFFDELNAEGLAGAVQKMEKMTFNSDDCKKQAKKFSKGVFKRKMTDFIKKHA